MKIANIFGLTLTVILCGNLSDAERREKRTLGTIFQFFGFKIVPLTESDKGGATAEKYQFPAQTQRNPKFIRIQTVMPFVEMIETSTVAAQQPSSTTSSPLTTTTAEASTTSEPTEAPIEMTSKSFEENAPLRIILPDTMLSSSEVPSSTSTEAFSEATEVSSTTVMNEMETTKQAPSEPLDEMQKLDADLLSIPLSLAPFQSFESLAPKRNRENENFELFKSNDVTSSFFGKPSVGIFPQFLMPPRPFALPATQNAASRFSTSRSSMNMNMNGQQFNYLTFH